MQKVFSPMTTGNGAWILHKHLSDSIPGYDLKSVKPYYALFTPGLKLFEPSNGEYDIYHSAPDLGSAMIPKDVAVVHTFHNFYFDDFMLKHSSVSQRVYYLSLLKYSINKACQCSDRIVCVSDFIADLVLKYMPEHRPKIMVIKNGIDSEQFKPGQIPHDDAQVKILFAGNPTKRKGLEILLNFADSLPDNCILQCTSGARDVKIAEHPKIKLLGHVPHSQMQMLYQQSDILFFPTLREGLSLVSLEAMSCGLPIVTTKDTSQQELIDHKKGGFLCDINHLEQMLDGIKQLANNKSMREEMGAYNREKILKHFDSKRMVNDYQSLFSNLTS